MRIRTAILAIVTMLMGGTGVAQTNRLSDVAGAIKLNPEAIVEKSGIVEDPQAAVRADENLVGAVLAECSVAADHLDKLVEEARNTILYGDSDLPALLEEASLDLERQIQELYLLRLTGELAEPASTARQAAEFCGAAVTGVREELKAGGVAFTAAKEEAGQCVRRLDQAKAQLVAITSPSDGKEASAAVSPSASGEAEPPATDEEIIAALCEKQRDKGSGAYDSCESDQYSALASINSRSAANELLDEAVFSDIRDICDELFPNDFVQRNNCEQDKMTATRLEME